MDPSNTPFVFGSTKLCKTVCNRAIHQLQVILVSSAMYDLDCEPLDDLLRAPRSVHRELIATTLGYSGWHALPAEVRFYNEQLPISEFDEDADEQCLSELRLTFAMRLGQFIKMRSGDVVDVETLVAFIKEWQPTSKNPRVKTSGCSYQGRHRLHFTPDRRVLADFLQNIRAGETLDIRAPHADSLRRLIPKAPLFRSRRVKSIFNVALVLAVQRAGPLDRVISYRIFESLAVAGVLEARAIFAKILYGGLLGMRRNPSRAYNLAIEVVQKNQACSPFAVQLACFVAGATTLELYSSSIGRQNAFGFFRKGVKFGCQYSAFQCALMLVEDKSFQLGFGSVNETKTAADAFCKSLIHMEATASGDKSVKPLADLALQLEIIIQENLGVDVEKLEGLFHQNVALFLRGCP